MVSSFIKINSKYVSPCSFTLTLFCLKLPFFQKFPVASGSKALRLQPKMCEIKVLWSPIDIV